MEHNIEKLKKDLSRCIAGLRRRELRNGLKTDRVDGLVFDYHERSFDNDPDAQEYRQLQIALGIRRKNDGDGDPDGMPQRVRLTRPHKPSER